MFQRAWILLTLLAVLPMATSCSTDNSERARSAIEVADVAEGGVFVCGMRDAGNDRVANTTDDFTPAGHILVTLKNRPYNPFISAPDGSPYGNFHVTSVEVTWSAANASTPIANLTPYNYRAGYDVTIPKDEQRSFAVMLVPFYMKADPFFDGLRTNATLPFTAVANMRFFGHDSGSEQTIVVEGSCIVEFIGYIIQEN